MAEINIQEISCLYLDFFWRKIGAFKVEIVFQLPKHAYHVYRK